MLDQLLTKCTSLAHFNSVVGFIDQVATALKNSFGGSLESEIASIISSLIEQNAQTPMVPPATSTTPPVSKSPTQS